MQCIRELYSPYDVIVDRAARRRTARRTTSGIAAGRPENIGYSASSIVGIAPGAPGCNPRENVISFSFANLYGGSRRVKNICETVAQETAHSYGLDHAFEFADGRSACTDPMTYRRDCGGQKFFRNDNATCGENAPRARAAAAASRTRTSACSPIFGAGTPITTPPTLDRQLADQRRHRHQRRGRASRSQAHSAASPRSSSGSTTTSGRP